MITTGGMPYSILHYGKGRSLYVQIDATNDEVKEKIIGLLEDGRTFKVEFKKKKAWIDTYEK